MLIVDTKSFDDNGLCAQLREVVGKLQRLSPLHRAWYGVTAIAKNGFEVNFFDDRLKYEGRKPGRCARLWMYEDKNSKWVYKINSPRITNDKYPTHSSHYNEKFTRSPDKLYDLAKDYVRPLPWDTVLEAYSNHAVQKHTIWEQEGESEYRNKIHKILNRDIPFPILDALIAERAMNIRFCNALLNDLTNNEVVAAYQEFITRRKTNKYALAVYAQSDRPEGVSEDMEIIYTVPLSKDEQVKSSSRANFPIDRQEQLAMLGMVNAGVYLPNVGYRASDHIYYLY